MTMTDVFYAIGDFCQWTFKFIKLAGNAPNVFFWLIIVSLVIVWLRMQAKYNKEAQENGTLK
jgi:hypothetical protein